MDTLDLLESQLRAARNALEAAAIAIDVSLQALQAAAASEPPGEGEPGIITAVECRHEGAVSAQVSGGPQRDYCRLCQSFVYAGGRTEKVNEDDPE